MDEQLEIKKLERDILDDEICIMLMQFEKEVLDKVFGIGKEPDRDGWARRIVAHCREQIS